MGASDTFEQIRVAPGACGSRARWLVCWRRQAQGEKAGVEDTVGSWDLDIS